MNVHRLSQLSVVLIAGLFSLHANEPTRPNILFIAVDDLRPELKCFGADHIHSPNLDRLANQSTLFERAYCMVPTCGASRASLMTGIRPAHNRFVNYLTWAERDAPEATTLNTHFKTNGYVTHSIGKVFHHQEDNLKGWSTPPWRPTGGLAKQYKLPENQARHRHNLTQETKPNRGPAFEAAEVDDEAYPDGQIANQAVDRIRVLSEAQEPFFLAVGFLKPHLPFNCPKRYWDLYNPDAIHLPSNYHPPQDVPEGAVHHFGELRAYDGIPNQGILSPDLARQLIHGYYACVSYTDAQIGKLLDALKANNVAENTIVVVWGDHGWNLGEHTMWCKHSCFEVSLRAPLILSAPAFRLAQTTQVLTEFIDIYPTLCELAGLSRPSHLEGRSLVPVLENPDVQWHRPAISRYRNGDTLRTKSHRFTLYSQPNGKPIARMLYDHRDDPQENRNLVKEVDHQALAREFERALRQGMGKSNP